MNINLANLYYNKKKYNVAIEKYIEAENLIKNNKSMDGLALRTEDGSRKK